MGSSESKESEHYTYVALWVDAFMHEIENLIDSADGKRICVVAISRKMPRLLNWIERRFLEGERKEKYLQLRDKFELTSEIAIPFLSCQFAENNGAIGEWLIIDDTIARGFTITTVAQDIQTYFGVKPRVMAVVSKQAFSPGQLNASKVITPTILASDSAIQNWMNFICECNLSTSLPIDVEFPVLYTCEAYKELSHLWFDGQWQSYRVEHDDAIAESINFFSESKDLRDYKIDFSKIRIFDGIKERKLSVFAPRFLRQSIIEQEDVFRNEQMAAIWIRMLSYYRCSEHKSLRGYQSLAVAINYLLSLSTFNEHTRDIDKLPVFRIKKEDLNLIFGLELATELENPINNLLEERIVEDNILGFVELPDMIVPDKLSESYTYYRLMALAKNINEPDFQLKVIEEVFDLTHFVHGVVDELDSIFHVWHSEIFESFDSIENLFLQGGVVDSRVPINKCIDKLIDTGRIIPKYEKTRTMEGEVFWRRYFTSSYSTVNL